MEERTCTGDCLKCSVQQQIYCGSRHGHAIMGVLPSLFERLDRIEAALASFAKNTEIINPLKDDAQKGSGADNREPSPK